jgi:hypothetical protein
MPTDQSAKAKSKLRWYQFSLRTLLIVVTLFAVACSWFAVKMNQARKQKKAVDAIRKVGGAIFYDYWTEGQARLETHPEPLEPHWLQQLIGEDFFHNVTYVHLGGEKVSDQNLEHLKVLDQVEDLILDDSHITDAGLDDIKGLKQLIRLSLVNTQVTDAGLLSLEGLEKLRFLSLSRTAITDAGLEHLKGLRRLKRLDVTNTKVTDARASTLASALPNCKIEH